MCTSVHASVSECVGDGAGIEGELQKDGNACTCMKYNKIHN